MAFVEAVIGLRQKFTDIVKAAFAEEKVFVHAMNKVCRAYFFV